MMGMGMTHDVKNSKAGRNGAATEIFLLMTFLRRRDPRVKKLVIRVCRNTPALGPTHQGPFNRLVAGSNPARGANACSLLFTSVHKVQSLPREQHGANRPAFAVGMPVAH